MYPFKKQIQIALLALLGCSALFIPARADESPEQLKSQEDWLRYSNWEHRAKFKRPVAKSESSDSDDKKLPLPEHPGSQTVEGGQSTVPGWAFQQPQQSQRPAEIIIGAESFGSTRNAVPYFGGYSYPPFFAGSSWRYGAGAWGRGLTPAWGSGWGGLGGWGSGWSRGRGFGPVWGGAFGMPFAGFGAGYGSGFQQSRLGPTVIQTGPSPASGNYYQPSTGDSSASGNYYASGTPWQVPLNGPNNPKDYWGPAGNPFQK